MKTCLRCSASLSTAAFSKHSRSADGLQSWCKKCQAAYGEENRETRRARSSAWYHANKGRAAANAKEYRKANLPRYAKHAAAARNRDPEKIKQLKNAWRRANRTKEAAYARSWARRHPEKIAARTRNYVARNRAGIRAHNARRRARVLQATPIWANHSAMRAIYAQAEALTLATGIEHHVDHIVPLKSKVVCGLHCPANLQILAGDENMSKGNRSWPDALGVSPTT